MTDLKNREGFSKVKPYGSNFVNSQDNWCYFSITMSELKRPNIRDYMENKAEDDEDGEWYEQYATDMEIYMQLEKIQRFQDSLKQDYGIDEETWNNTPEKMKAIMVELHNEVEKHNYMMEELECWKDNMPI